MSVFRSFKSAKWGGGVAISYLPSRASEYLILDAEKNPSVVDWNVTIQTRSSDATGEIVYTTVKRIQISDTYYTKIEDQFNTGDHFITVTGVNASREIIVNEGPIPICTGCPTDGGEACLSICEGPDYAWEGYGYKSFGTSAPPATLTISSAAHPVTYQPFYQYFSESQFDDLSNSLFNYYNVSSWAVGQGGKIIKLLGVTAGDNIVDASNDQLTGTVYGVQKYLGPWANNGVVQAENLAISMTDLCLQGIPTVVSIINSNSFTSWLTPNLACSGSSSSVPGASSSDAIDFFIDCSDAVEAWLEVEGNSMVEAMELFDCLGGGATNPGFDWPSEVSVVNIAPFISNGEPILVFQEEDFYDPNREFVSPVINLKQGLYTIGIQFNDASYYTLFFESKRAATHTYALSNFLEATAFPVPIIDDEFSLNLHAYAKLKFDYVLYDLNGTELYRKNFVLQKDHQRTHLIKVNGGIPSGQLVNKFIFEDGSELQFQSVK